MSSRHITSDTKRETSSSKSFTFPCPVMESGRTCRKVYDTRCGLKKHLNAKHGVDLVSGSSTEVYRPSREDLQRKLKVIQRSNGRSPRTRTRSSSREASPRVRSSVVVKQKERRQSPSSKRGRHSHDEHREDRQPSTSGVKLSKSCNEAQAALETKQNGDKNKNNDRDSIKPGVGGKKDEKKPASVVIKAVPVDTKVKSSDAKSTERTSSIPVVTKGASLQSDRDSSKESARPHCDKVGDKPLVDELGECAIIL